MTEVNRQDKIESYGAAHRYLLEALESFPKEMWQFKLNDAEWSIHEIIIHITDSEANSYIRCRRFLAEPGRDLLAYDESKWAQELDYHEQSTDDALELFHWLRKKSYDLIRAASEEVWDRQCFHPEDGTITMSDWLDTYERHVPEHVEQMKAVYEKWKTQST